jgi:hypothetical protein
MHSPPALPSKAAFLMRSTKDLFFGHGGFVGEVFEFHHFFGVLGCGGAEFFCEEIWTETENDAAIIEDFRILDLLSLADFIWEWATLMRR